MPRLTGKLLVDAEGALCLEMQLTPENPTLYEIPLKEVLEEYLGQKVAVDVLPVRPREEADQ